LFTQLRQYFLLFNTEWKVKVSCNYITWFISISTRKQQELDLNKFCVIPFIHRGLPSSRITKLQHSEAELEECRSRRKVVFGFETRFSVIFGVFGGGKTHSSHFSSFLMVFFVPFSPAKSTKRPPNFMKNGTKIEAKITEKTLL